MKKEDQNGLELEVTNGTLLDDSPDRKPDKEDVDVEVENYADKALIYGVNDTPPIHITIVCGLQVSPRL